MNGKTTQRPGGPVELGLRDGMPLIQAVGLKREYLLGKTRVQALREEEERLAREQAEAVRRARKLARKKMQREGLLPSKPKPAFGAAR